MVVIHLTVLGTSHQSSVTVKLNRVIIHLLRKLKGQILLTVLYYAISHRHMKEWLSSSALYSIKEFFDSYFPPPEKLMFCHFKYDFFVTVLKTNDANRPALAGQ